MASSLSSAIAFPQHGMSKRLRLALQTAPRVSRCIFCQSRYVHSTVRRLQPDASPKPPPTAEKPQRPHVRVYDGELVPRPLDRPLGLPHPPQPGQNSGRDDRSWREKRDDYADYGKHLERRKSLMKSIFEQNYFRDLGNIGVTHGGKSMVAPSTPYRSHLAAYFPNLVGRTLAAPSSDTVDTTPVLRGRVSIVSMIRDRFAEEQCRSFTGASENPALAEFLQKEKAAAGGGVVQTVRVQVEENPLRWGLVRLFLPSVRRQTQREDWGRYFLVRRGLSDEIREALGMWNSKVGYVFVLDGMCRVRWAGNGDAQEQERKSLVSCVRRLVEEAKGVQRMRVSRQDAKPTRPVGGGEPAPQEMPAVA